jgi:hypothetical protein
MRPFVLIDLWSQARFIPEEIRGWTEEQFIQWLERFGAVERIELPALYETHCYFRSVCGPCSTFRISATEGLVLIGDHFLMRPWAVV